MRAKEDSQCFFEGKAVLLLKNIIVKFIEIINYPVSILNRIFIMWARLFNISLPLKYYKNRLYNSQYGEDGILDEIFRRLNIKTGWFVEFGASDGIFCNNTSGLVKKGWKGIYIEGDVVKFQELEKNMRKHKDIICICKYISLEKGYSINETLANTDIPKDFDLFNIDIDGNDYWVWESLIYIPKVVVIEYNSNFNPDESKVIKYNPNHSWDETRYYGASALAMYKLGRLKGYTLVAKTKDNLIFIKDEYMKERFKSFDVRSIIKNEVHKITTKEFIEV